MFVQNDIRRIKRIVMDFTTLFVNIGNWIVTEGLKALVAFIVLLILFKITNVICRKLAKLMRKKKLDEAVVRVSETWARHQVRAFHRVHRISRI